MACASNVCGHKCDTASQTLHWINAIFDFIRPYSFLFNAHVVNFFQDRLWEAVDKEWMDCLRNEQVENLLQIPSGFVQDYWPESLKNYIITSRSLVFPRKQADLQTVLPGFHVATLNNVLVQGMNKKKKHEVEILSSVVSLISTDLGAHTIVDVGAGQVARIIDYSDIQFKTRTHNYSFLPSHFCKFVCEVDPHVLGYLAQVLSFHYNHFVLAIDASSHHGRVTDSRAGRIKKHYLSQMRKSRSEDYSLNFPKTITCRVMSVDVLNNLGDMSLCKEGVENISLIGENQVAVDKGHLVASSDDENSMVLAGLHACGDLSVIMLRSFLECEKVKAVISIGCCYNLLSDNESCDEGPKHSFPLSSGVKSAGLYIGKIAKDLACQSAERWRTLESNSGIHNFELHGLRAVFQMVLCKCNPEIVKTYPSIGRQGKALRRKQQRRTMAWSGLDGIDKPETTKKVSKSDLALDSEASSHAISASNMNFQGTKSDDRYSLLENFTQSGLSRLGIKPARDMDLRSIWNEAEPFLDLIGPYWSLRAVLGPLLETLLLLDRLLFLQEQDTSLETFMIPIFDPELSPRNVAIIAKKCKAKA